MGTRERLGELRSLHAAGTLPSEAVAEFHAHLKEFATQQPDGTWCVCDNNYGCNPSNPPPGCGTCTCYNI